MLEQQDKQIKIILEGERDNDNHVEIGTFLSTVSAFKSALSDADKAVNNGMGGAKFLVTDLSHSSPASMTIEPTPLSHRNDKTENLLDYFYAILDGISSGDTRGISNYCILENLRKLSKPIGTKITALTLVVGQKTCDITKNFYRNVDKALESSESCFGSLEGYLEQINVHGENKFFTIYPQVGPVKVKCVFPKRLHDAAVNGIAKCVTISGELKYRARASFPHEIAVTTIDIEPSDEELPTFNDLLGIIPDFAKDLPSEEIIRTIRNEWD